MTTAARREKTKAIPKRRKRHYSYDESVEASQKLIEDEPVDIEGAHPAEENEPVETADETPNDDPTAFKE